MKKSKNGKLNPEKGDKFNLLTCIEHVKTNIRGGKIFLWQCECGNQKEILGSSVVRKATKSCGCLNDKARKAKRKSIEETSITSLYNQYRLKGLKRGYEWKLSKSDFKILLMGVCFYCGAAPSNVHKGRYEDVKYIYNGVDRVNNSKGYVKNNTVSCCKHCNRAKNSMSFDEFKEWIKNVNTFLNL